MISFDQYGSCFWLLGDSQSDLAFGLIKDGLFSRAVLDAQLLDSSAVIYVEFAAEEGKNSQRWPMTTFLDSFSINFGSWNLITLRSISFSQQIEDFMRLEAEARNNVSFSCGFRIF
jgi:hypothetical protein